MTSPRDFSRPAVRRGWSRELLGPLDESRWNDLARELFAWQYARVPAFRRLCEGHGVTPRTLKSWRDIPAMPQQLFKREKLFSHGNAEAEAVYETSGTTTGEPGRQYLLRTDLYRTVTLEGASRAGLFEEAGKDRRNMKDMRGIDGVSRMGLFRGAPEFHFLTASPRELPHSSLSAMFGFWHQASGQKKERFWMRKGGFDFLALREALSFSAKKGRPIAICGTAFSFVHLLDAWTSPLPLPPGSRLVETGGFKGRSREVSKPELYDGLARIFGLKDDALWNEYGMSELSSQAYARGTNGLHVTPPWARVQVCDPVTGREVRMGREGLVRWIDLANVDSVMALQTLDRAERRPEGFRLIGRLARTEPRGCSLSAEDLKTASLS